MRPRRDRGVRLRSKLALVYLRDERSYQFAIANRPRGGPAHRLMGNPLHWPAVEIGAVLDQLDDVGYRLARDHAKAHLLAYNLLRTVMSVAAAENGIEPRQVSFKGAKQAVTAFAPKIEVARSKGRAMLIDAMLTTIAYHRVRNRPGRWEPRARKRRPKPGLRLMQSRARLVIAMAQYRKGQKEELPPIQNDFRTLCFASEARQKS
jgi:hypothetical protein